MKVKILPETQQVQQKARLKTVHLQEAVRVELRELQLSQYIREVYGHKERKGHPQIA